MFNKKPPPPPSMATPRNSVTARSPVTPAQARNFSEAAALAAQHVDDLESTIHRLQDDFQNSEIRNNLLKEANDILHEQITKLTNERNSYYEQFTALKTSLEISGKIVLDALDAAKVASTKLPAPPTAELEAPAPAEPELQDRILDDYRPKAHKKYDTEGRSE